MIEVLNLSKKYANSHLAVNDVSFNIQKGEIVGFLGPNGAGKSTIMNILTGYLSLSAGTVKIDGFDILENPIEAKCRIGYLPEIPPLYPDMTVTEYLYFIYDLKKVTFPKEAHIAEILKLVKLEDHATRLIKHLSKGYRQRVGIAQALIGNPDVLILDEPTVGLDPQQILEIRELIAKLGLNHTVIVSSHILSEIQAVCKRIIIINHGCLVADDTPENLSKNLSSNHCITVRVAGKEDETYKILQSVKGVQSIIKLGTLENGSFDFVLEPEEDADIRAAVAERLAERKKALLSLSANELSLEQIFLKIVNDELLVKNGPEQLSESEALPESLEESEKEDEE